jgi:predicted NBD/HSP70 family sugar kinase
LVNNTYEVKKINEEYIREAIIQSERCTKTDIAKSTGLSIATCNTVLNEMLERKEIKKIDQTDNSIGRPADLFTYDPEYIHALALFVEEHNTENILSYSIANAVGEILEDGVEHPKVFSYEALESFIIGMYKKDPKIGAVALGIPGVAKNGTIESCDIESLEHVPFSDNIQKKLGIPAIVENDMNAITYYFYKENALHDEYFAVIYFPDNPHGFVGCGFIVDGKILRGASMLVGELWIVAETFGIDKKTQYEMTSQKPSFIELISKIIVTVCCTINPAHIVLSGNNLGDEDIPGICGLCEKHISPLHLPGIQVDNDLFRNYLGGLIHLVLNSALYPLSK